MTTLVSIYSYYINTRYYAVCIPLHAAHTWTKTKAGMVCLISWLVSILLTSPILAIANYQDDPHNPTCTTEVDPPWTKAFFLSIISLFFWLPLCILIVLYVIIARHLTAGISVNRHAGTDINGHLNYLTHIILCIGSISEDCKAGGGRCKAGAVTHGRHQIVVMMGTVVVTFFACLLPFKVMTMWVVLSPVEILDHINIEVYYNILYFCRLMFYINSAINPILYNIMSSR